MHQGRWRVKCKVCNVELRCKSNVFFKHSLSERHKRLSSGEKLAPRHSEFDSVLGQVLKGVAPGVDGHNEVARAKKNRRMVLCLNDGAKVLKHKHVLAASSITL